MRSLGAVRGAYNQLLVRRPKNEPKKRKVPTRVGTYRVSSQLIKAESNSRFASITVAGSKQSRYYMHAEHNDVFLSANKNYQNLVLTAIEQLILEQVSFAFDQKVCCLTLQLLAYPRKASDSKRNNGLSEPYSGFDSLAFSKLSSLCS